MTTMVPVPSSEPIPLVDKYKPESTKKIVGQQGPNNNVQRLSTWLRNWYKNLDKKPIPGKFGADDGVGYRAALLSGPPGVGKTTTAELVCKELGYPYIALNASDTRNKSSLESEVRSLLANTTLESFSSGTQALTSRHVLIMDEVDGMAGNEDRGGIAEMIQLIKKTRVPIICICNDRSHMKMRSLVNYCYDIRFYKPKVEQIKGAMLSICYKEGIKISHDALTDLINSSNQDIRQVLHYLSLLVESKDKATSIQPGTIKDVKLGPFDAVKALFAHSAQKPLYFNERSDLFFTDFSLMPLFVYENYPSVIPQNVNRSNIAKRLSLGEKAMRAIAFANLIETEIRTSNNWSLLPLQAAFSAVLPSYYLSGTAGFVEFPKLLGKISTINKNDRLVQELKMHMSLKLSSSKSALSLDYIPAMINKVYKPLRKKGADAIPKILETMNHYSIRKEDLDTMLEFLWSNQKNPAYDLDSKTKAALTRACNSKGDLLPYTEIKTKKAARKRTAAEVEGLSDEESEEEEEEEKILIKPKKVVKKGSPKEKTSPSKTKKAKASPKRGTKRPRSPSTARGRGKGRGKK